MLSILLKKTINFTHNRQTNYLLRFMTNNPLFIIKFFKKQSNQMFFFDTEDHY